MAVRCADVREHRVLASHLASRSTTAAEPMALALNGHEKKEACKMQIDRGTSLLPDELWEYNIATAQAVLGAVRL
jgi:hypothetical protein